MIIRTHIYIYIYTMRSKIPCIHGSFNNFFCKYFYGHQIDEFIEDKICKIIYALHLKFESIASSRLINKCEDFYYYGTFTSGCNDPARRCK